MTDQPVHLYPDVHPPVALPHEGRVPPRALAGAPCLPSFAAAPRTGLPAATGLQVGLTRDRHVRDGRSGLLSGRG
jgi:hypothetical protein